MSQKGRHSLSHLQAVEALSAYADKQRRKGQRKNAAVQYNGPTPERVSKTTEGITATTIIPGQGPVPPVKNHQIVSPVEKYKAFLPAELEDAARQLLKDFLLAEAGQKITSSYDGISSQHHGPKHGGVQDHIREAQSTVSLICAEWHPDFVQDIRWFVTQVVSHQDGSAMRFEDSGAKISPWRSPDAQKGCGYGAFYRTLCLAARFYGRQRALGRRKDPPSMTEVRSLLSASRAKAQQIREREAKRDAAEARRKLK